MLKNTPQAYGLISKLLHWSIALALVGLFILGLWMVDLGYYDSWYQKAPHYHKSLGIMVATAMLLRLLWRALTPQPQPLVSHRPWEIRLAKIAHILLYLLTFAIVISGYLISTADGRGIAIFNWFTIPALGSFIDNQEDVAGYFHYWLAVSLISLSSLHALAAFKHHFFDKDRTLKRMI
ncbi:cytochrome b [Aestuariicella hydrocarbonica]|uniref:Cytochrome b n=1 Tax=Pseudomaricurvus hydrocarbonicus TaxID=1470433 RepID=A0A9E5MJQ4_9GAMM|nr:cytochrome b [Aestuariicella hydrocarbonica]NHO65484.1 cytochrome b [Aestuariicella hydrocarbonica]